MTTMPSSPTTNVEFATSKPTALYTVLGDLLDRRLHDLGQVRQVRVDAGVRHVVRAVLQAFEPLDTANRRAGPSRAVPTSLHSQPVTPLSLGQGGFGRGDRWPTVAV